MRNITRNVLVTLSLLGGAAVSTLASAAEVQPLIESSARNDSGSADALPTPYDALYTNAARQTITLDAASLGFTADGDVTGQVKVVSTNANGLSLQVLDATVQNGQLVLNVQVARPAGSRVNQDYTFNVMNVAGGNTLTFTTQVLGSNPVAND